jgi:hypothetical protein
MTETTRSSQVANRPTSRIRTRALGVGGAVVATALIWLAAQPFDVELRAGPSNGDPIDVNLGMVVATTLAVGLLGWAALVLLERLTGRARTIWSGLALGVLLISLLGPLSADAEADTKIVLSLMHLAVGAVLIPIFRR